MRHFNHAVRSVVLGDAKTQPGLFRREGLDIGLTGTMANLFANLKRLNRGTLIAEQPERHLQGTCLRLERSEGHATWELYRLDEDLYVVTADGTYEQARVETVPGEGLVEFHLRLSGTLELKFPKVPQVVTVTGPRLLVLYQPSGVAIAERVVPGFRDTCVSLYCRPELLANIARSNGISQWSLLDEITAQRPGTVWYRQSELRPALLFIGKSLLENPYHRGIRLMNVEAKALELLCEVLAGAQKGIVAPQLQPSDSEARQLENARRLLSSNLSEPLRIDELSRAVGMSGSRLRRAFKARYGKTVFEYGLECRMARALDLLRHCRMPVGQVAFSVGYRHQTSFAAAFYDYYGFQPRKARTELH